MKKVTNSCFYSNIFLFGKGSKSLDFPLTLKEGEAVFYSITANHLNGFLFLNKHSHGTIELSGYYEIAQRKKIHSKSSIKFNTGKYGIGKIVSS